MFLCVALMSGAGADYLLSGSYHLGYRIAAFSLTVIALLIVFFLFNPNNANPPDENIITNFAWGYSIFTFAYCILIKADIFLKEPKHNKIRYR